MLKIVPLIAVPSAIGSIGLLYDPSAQTGPMPAHEAYVVQMGLAFDPEAVRAALPAGLNPVPGSTGGIAVYSIQEDPALPARTAGFVWIDVDYGVPARYMIRSFEGTAPAPEQVADAGPQDDTLYAAAGVNDLEALDLVVRPSAGTCSAGVTAMGQLLFVTDSRGRLDVLPNPFVQGWCGAEVVTASVTAPAGGVLGSFTPGRILWAGVATPFGGTLPEFMAD